MCDLYQWSGSLNISRRISDLREKGYTVENRKEYKGTNCHSFYRIPR